jgi:hypothetical protein
MAKTKDKTADEERMMELVKAVVCDFSGASRRWGYRWGQIELDTPILIELVNTPAPDDVSDEDLHQIKVGQREARQQLHAIMDEQNALIAQVLRDVPAEFLVRGAPEEIDWGDPDNILDWVREDCIGYVVLGVTLAKGESAKNLPTLTLSNGGKMPQ